MREGVTTTISPASARAMPSSTFRNLGRKRGPRNFGGAPRPLPFFGSSTKGGYTRHTFHYFWIRVAGPISSVSRTDSCNPFIGAIG